jgi:hypothetical protein
MGNVVLNGGTSGQITLQPTAIAGTNTLTLPAATDTLVGKATTDTLTNKTLTTPTMSGVVLSAGTASVAPLNFTAGTNLTSALAGAVEYDGKVFYGTPIGSQRGIIPGAQFFRLNSDLAGANVTTAQSTFGVGVTLSASTVYAFDTYIILSKSAGTTSHSILFGFGGTATVNNILYGGLHNGNNGAFTSGIRTTAETYDANTVSATVISSGITSAARTDYSQLKGTVSINAGGTFIPQYTLNNAPGGAYSTLAGSYFYIYPISASGANTSVGTWA